jgi:excisionase family DNA binding protein
VDGATDALAERTPSKSRTVDGKPRDRTVVRRSAVDTGDPLLTKDQAAELLNVAVRFIDRCVVERRIRYVKFGRYIRIPQSAIDEYVAASTVYARPTAAAGHPNFHNAPAT